MSDRILAYPPKSKPKICDKHRRIGANAYVVSNTVDGKKFYCIDCFVNEIIKRERNTIKKTIKRMIEVAEELRIDNVDVDCRCFDDVLDVIKEWETFIVSKTQRRHRKEIPSYDHRKLENAFSR